jgi:hypothetical protein
MNNQEICDALYPELHLEITQGLDQDLPVKDIIVQDLFWELQEDLIDLYVELFQT